MNGFTRVLISLVIVSISNAVIAQDEARSRASFAKAEKARKDGNFQAAIQHYQDGYIALTRPAFLFNIALMYANQKSCDDSLYYYRKHLYLETDSQKRRPSEKASVKLGDQCPDGGDELGAVMALREAWLAESQYRCEAAIENYKKYLKLGDHSTKRRQAKASIKRLSAVCFKKTEGTKPRIEESESTRKKLDRCNILYDKGQCGDAMGCFRSYLQKPDATHVEYAEKSLIDLEKNCTEKTGPGMTKGRVSFDLGVGFFSMGSIETPTVVSPSLGAAITIVDSGLLIDVGARVGFVPLRFEYMTDSGVSTFTNMAGTVSAAYYITPSLLVRGELGAGLSIWSGLGKPNPFTEANAPATGPLAMFLISFTFNLEYDFSDSFYLSLTPFAYAGSPAKSGLVPSFINRIDITGGVGYRF